MADSSAVKTEIIAFASGKGGTGKTSFIAALGYALTYSEHQVLLIDTDRATDGLSLFILGQHGISQIAEYSSQNTFSGILDVYAQTRTINAEPRKVNRSGANDHDIFYRAIISAKNIYGELNPEDDPNLSGDADWKHDRATFKAGVHMLFESLRAQALYDYILVDTRGGFSFESIEVAAASDSLVLVTEATNTNFFQDRNLMDRIASAAGEAKTKLLLRGIIINKATEGEEVSYRNQLTKEYGLQLEDTFPVALDPEAAAVYKTQQVIYQRAPGSSFAHDSLAAFQQILRVVTRQWPESRARRWNGVVGKVATAIAEHNAKIEAEEARLKEEVKEHNALLLAHAELKTKLAASEEARDQEKSRQDILIQEIKLQAEQREQTMLGERAREELRRQEERAAQSQEVDRVQTELKRVQVQLDEAQALSRELEQQAVATERKALESDYFAQSKVSEQLAHRQVLRTYLYAAIGFLGLLLVLVIALYLSAARENQAERRALADRLSFSDKTVAESERRRHDAEEKAAAKDLELARLKAKLDALSSSQPREKTNALVEGAPEIQAESPPPRVTQGDTLADRLKSYREELKAHDGVTPQVNLLTSGGKPTPEATVLAGGLTANGFEVAYGRALTSRVPQTTVKFSGHPEDERGASLLIELLRSLGVSNLAEKPIRIDDTKSPQPGQFEVHLARSLMP